MIFEPTKAAATGIERLRFFYDASQRRINKQVIHTDPLQSVSYLYIYDAGGNMMAVYENYYDTETQTWKYKLTENIMYGSSRLGMYKAESVLDITGTALNVGNGSSTGNGTVTTPPGNSNVLIILTPGPVLPPGFGLPNHSILLPGSGTIHVNVFTINPKPGIFFQTDLRFELTDHLGNVRAQHILC